MHVSYIYISCYYLVLIKVCTLIFHLICFEGLASVNGQVQEQRQEGGSPSLPTSPRQLPPWDKGDVQVSSLRGAKLFSHSVRKSLLSAVWPLVLYIYIYFGLKISIQFYISFCLSVSIFSIGHLLCFYGQFVLVLNADAYRSGNLSQFDIHIIGRVQGEGEGGKAAGAGGTGQH